MAFPYGREEKQTHSLIESTSVAGQTALAVCNPDGSNIGGGGGTSDVNLVEVGGAALALGQAAATASLPVVQAASPMQALAQDATGQDAYATVKTPTANASHIIIVLTGSNPAILSLDDGVTDHIFVAGPSVLALDQVAISSGVAIKAKNGTGGSNYTGLNISIW